MPNRAGDVHEDAQRAVRERLAAIANLRGVDAAVLDLLCGVGRTMALATGRRLLRQGEPARHLAMVLSGRLKMARRTPDDHTALLAIYGPGDLAGVGPALGGYPSDATVTALEPTVLLRMEGRALVTALGTRPTLLAGSLALLTRQISECRGCALELAFQRTEPRLAGILYGLASSSGTATDGGVLVPIRLSRRELAQMAGTTVETAIRVMSRWAREGLVTTRDDGFLIADPEGLRHAAEMR